MPDTAAPKRERPLSPHLQVYRLPLTALMSIAHRICGAALAVGTLMVAWVLIAAAYGPGAYETAMGFASSGLGQFMLFGWSAALFYHMSNGVRHLIWDTGCLLEMEQARKAGYAVLAAAAILTALTWLAVLG